MTARAAFKQSDVTRLVRGVEAAGVKVAKVEYEGGKIIILTSAAPQADEEGPNEWDEVFNETPPA